MLFSVSQLSLSFSEFSEYYIWSDHEDGKANVLILQFLHFFPVLHNAKRNQMFLNYNRVS